MGVREEKEAAEAPRTQYQVRIIESIKCAERSMAGSYPRIALRGDVRAARHGREEPAEDAHAAREDQRRDR